jgi:hypothetical protein
MEKKEPIIQRVKFFSLVIIINNLLSKLPLAYLNCTENATEFFKHCIHFLQYQVWNSKCNQIRFFIGFVTSVRKHLMLKYPDVNVVKVFFKLTIKDLEKYVKSD